MFDARLAKSRRDRVSHDQLIIGFEALQSIDQLQRSQFHILSARFSSTDAPRSYVGS